MTAAVNAGLVLASNLSDFTSYMAAGISKGAIVSLAALGFLLTYKATGVVNFAQGSLISLGAYFAIWGSERWNMPIVIAYLFAMAVLFVIGVGIERVAYAPLRGRSIHVVVIATLGASTIIDTLINLWYGPNPRALATPADGSFDLFGATIRWHRVLILVVTLVVVAALIFAFNRTQYGRQVRAVAADRDTARLHGAGGARRRAHRAGRPGGHHVRLHRDARRVLGRHPRRLRQPGWRRRRRDDHRLRRAGRGVLQLLRLPRARLPEHLAVRPHAARHRRQADRPLHAR
jgi:ABC-type branched-subunit amino acid transport system permease subunit